MCRFVQVTPAAPRRNERVEGAAPRVTVSAEAAEAKALPDMIDAVSDLKKMLMDLIANSQRPEISADTRKVGTCVLLLFTSFDRFPN